ncbi:MAG: hypothetical protein ACK4NY_12595 [Spirosomataceae bacterium]
MKILNILAVLASCWINDLQTKSNTATLIIYRTKEFWGTAYEVRINENIRVENFRPNNAVEIQIPEGVYVIESKKFDSKSSKLKIDAKAGNKYYIKGIEDNDFLLQALHLRLVDENKGIIETQKLRKIQKTVPK